jgi:hypothetical protein
VIGKPPSIAPYFLRDLAEGIHQQMYFWGQDVVRPEGNFLVESGFERLPTMGLKGTSRYRCEWQGGHIELYGACAGWYGDDGGFTYIRPRHRCSIWLSSESTPIPGAWQDEHIDTSATKDELYQASFPFLDWLISYEKTILDRFGPAYRQANYASYQKVPKAKAWIKPSLALTWFHVFRNSPELLIRPRKLARNHHV